MAQHGSHALSSRTRLLATLIAGCFAGTALALPTGAQIAAGTAAITQAGNVLTVNNSANAILNWQQFNIAASEAVRFNQPSASSSVLNRVLGADPSSLLGQLTSNGRVWLVNPAGILVGPGARIDTAGFVASTLNLRNEDFLAGKLTFGGNAGAGSVVNQGAIATPGGGSVYLIAPNVSNEGLIATPGGETILAAGQTVQLLDTATPGVKVEVTGSTGNVTNLGSVVAAAGRVGMAGVLVRNSGTLNASSVVSAGGRIFLKASGDTYVDKDARITATGSRGGDIEVLGQRVAVMDRTVLDASGQSGGGSVRVGGDYQGKNPDIQNADVTYFGPQATLRADALGNGDGGKVIVWADDTTRAYGSISALGGVNGGKGGFVETSGHHLDTSGIRLSLGQGGTWLLDPYNITINAADSNVTGNPTFTPTASSAEVSAATINGLLEAGTSVIVDTTGGGGENGDITVAASIAKTAGPDATLTLKAHNDIMIDDVSIASSFGKLNVVLQGNQTGSGPTGLITVSGTSAITTNGGDLTVDGKTIAISASGAINAGAGVVNLASTGVDALTSIASAVSGANINIKTDNFDLLSGTLTATNAATITRYNNGNELQLGGVAADDASTLVVNLAELGNITANTYRFGDITSTGGLRVAGAVSIPATKTLSLLTSNIGGSQIVQDAGDTITATNLYVEGTAVTLNEANAVGNLAGKTKGQNFTFTNAAPLNIATVDGHTGIDVSATNNLILTTTGATSHITQSAAVIVPGTSSLTADAASSITLTNAANDFTGAVSVTGANVVALTDVNNLVMGNTTQASAITLTSGGILSGGSLAGTSLTATAANGITLAGGGTGPTTVGLTNTTSGNVSYTSSLANGTYTLTASGANNALGGSFTVNETVGKLSVGTDDILTKDGAVTLKTQMADGILTIGPGALVNTKNGTATGGTVTYVADQMVLEDGATTADLLVLEPNTAGTDIALGSTAADSPTTLGINLTEWGTFTANTLRVGSATAGALNVSGPLGGVFSLGLVAGGAITQAAAATITTPSLRASGASVNLAEANPVGVVAGTTTGGNFVYRSASKLTLSTVDGVAGINAGTGNVHLIGDLADAGVSGGVNQNAGAYVIASGLRIDSKGSVELNLSGGNDVTTLAADLYLTALGNGSLTYGDINALTIGTVLAQSGIKTNNRAVNVTTGTLLLVDGDAASNVGIGAGTANVSLQGANIQLGAVGGNGTKITGDSIKLRATSGAISTPATGAGSALSGTNVGLEADTFGFNGTKPTLNASGTIFYNKVTDNSPISTSALGGASHDAPTLVVGNHLTAENDTSGAITVDSAIANSYAGTKTLVLLSGAGITQTSAIATDRLAVYAGGAVALDIAAGNTITTLAGTTSSGDFAFKNAAALTVCQISGGDPLVTLTGVSAPAGGVTLTTSAGSITLNQPVAAWNTVILNAAGAITDGNAAANNVSALGLVALAATGIGHGNALETQVSYLEAVNSGANNIEVTNTGALEILSGMSNTGGNIVVDNTGGIATGNNAITAAGGNVVLTAHSPLTIGSGGISAGGSVTLTAGSAGSSTAGDTLTINGTVSGSTITLAGHATAGTSVPTGGNVTSQIYSAPPPAEPPPPPPTVAECTANSALSGCSSILPSLSACTADSTAAGCTAVLPTLATCTATPTATGCTSVLPTLATCTTNPTATGCTAVLPTLATCTTNPTATGCTAVLPSLSTCTTTPTAAGCASVLPTLATCTATPTAAGCTAVLPSLAKCTTDPTATGCTSVLPTLATCTATPTAAGCTTVLPTLASCTATPTAAGCTAVLPSLATCTANPTATGCTAVLPSLASCTATPTAAGCASVLPSVVTCTANPTAAGCTAVLPTLATCTTAPTTSGCTAVLPPLASCTTNSTQEGCAAVLPTLASCSVDATQAGCSTVLPPVAVTTTSVNEVVTVTAALTATSTETTPSATPALPTPTPLPTSGATSLVLLNAHQTIGGTEGTFGGSASTSTASSFSTTTASSGAAASGAGTEADQPAASKPAADTSSDDKSAGAKDKKDDQKEDKKDAVQAKKQEDKPTTKKPPICS